MILISPFSRKLRNGKPNAKNYPHWKELLLHIKDEQVVQIGVAGEEVLVPEYHFDYGPEKLAELLDACRIWISVDNFFPHFVQHYGKKRGIVLWGKSDPEIFGYPNNINLLKSRRNLRPGGEQFVDWQNVPYDPNVFVGIAEVLKHLRETK